MPSVCRMVKISCVLELFFLENRKFCAVTRLVCSVQYGQAGSYVTYSEPLLPITLLSSCGEMQSIGQRLLAKIHLIYRQQ